MSAVLPDPEVISTAIEAYLELAYEGPPPAAVLARVQALRSSEGHVLLAPAPFEREGEPPRRYHLRLGNRRYPHMKLTIEPSPDGRSHLFKADTHDSHICPAPDSAEHDTFRELMVFNRELAAAIGRAFEARGIPTFKAWLREDLERRRRG